METSDFCTCKDWIKLKNEDHDIFRYNKIYGWIISWIELTSVNNHSKIHRYGLKINYCPMCGRKLENN